MYLIQNGIYNEKVSFYLVALKGMVCEIMDDKHEDLHFIMFQRPPGKKLFENSPWTR